MNKIVDLIKKYKTLIKEAFLYGIIGLTCAGIDSLTYYFLTKISVEMYIANFIGVNVGIFLSFFLNAYFNFKQTNNLLTRFIKFVIVGYIGLGLSMLIMYFGVDVLKANDVIVKIVSVFIVAAIQFVLNKLFAFRSKKR